MKKKHWIAIILTVAMLLSVGGLIGLAQDLSDCEVTITVMTTDGKLISDADGLNGEATVRITQWDHDLQDHIELDAAETNNGIVNFTLTQDDHYDAEAEYERQGAPSLHGSTDFYIQHNEDTKELTIYVLQEDETDVHYEVGGAVGVSMHTSEGHHQHIATGVGTFPASNLRINVHNSPEETVNVTAFTVDGGWHENLVFSSAGLTAGQIAIQYDTSGSWADLPQAGTDVIVLDGEYDLQVRAMVSEETQDKRGPIYFKATLVSQ